MGDRRVYGPLGMPAASTPVKPVTIGTVEVYPPLVLAPMEDVTNLPFRRICRRIGSPGLVVSEFVSAMAAHYNRQAAFWKMQTAAEEHPVAIQIFGAEPDSMAEAALLAESQGADIVDINMGCWVPKVCKTGAGAALLNDPDRAAKIVEAVVKAVKVPVTVKVRAGWHYSEFTAPSLARRFEDCGIKALTLHARFARQGFEGEADWSLLEQLRSSVTVPLFGNGGVRTPEDALAMIDRTGCDGVMVGRAAIGCPWTLRSISEVLQGRPDPGLPTLRERIDTSLEHLQLTIDGAFEEQRCILGRDLTDAESDLWERRRTASLRGQLPLYFKGFPNASQLRAAIFQCSTYHEVETAISTHITEPN